MFLLSSIQAGCGAHTASCRWAPNVHRQAYEADQSPTAIFEVKNYWSFTFPPPFALVTCTGTALPSVWCCILCGPCISIHTVCLRKSLTKFCVLLTVHLDVILVNDQLDALFFNVFISTPLRVSSSKCSSSGGPTCINTLSGITHSSG